MTLAFENLALAELGLKFLRVCAESQGLCLRIGLWMEYNPSGYHSIAVILTPNDVATGLKH
jgi:hypothetical protein